MQELFKFTHQRDVEEIALQETEIKMETKSILERINAEKKQSIQVIKAENERALAEKRAQARAAEIVAKATAFQQKTELEANEEA